MKQTTCTDCCGLLKGEMRLEKVAPRSDRSLLFVTTQWTSSQTWYVVYKSMLAVMSLVWLPMDYYYDTTFFYKPRYGLWLIFGTDWAFLGLITTAVVHAVLIVLHHIRVKERPNQTDSINSDAAKTDDTEAQPIPLRYQAFWVIYTTSSNVGFVVGFSYWAFLMGYSKYRVFASPMGKMKHTLNMVLVIINTLIDGVPLRLMHIVYPMICGLLYVIFTGIYFAAGGMGPTWGDPSIYPVLSWARPRQALTTIVAEFLIVLMMQLILYGLYQVRLIVQALCGLGGRASTGSQLYQQEEPQTEQVVLIDEDTRANQKYASIDLDSR